MLKIMKNEEKIFRAWLNRYIDDGRGLNKKQLAKKLDISPSKLSYILTGRTKESGERYLQKLTFDLRQAALEATGVSYQEAIRIGQEEIDPIKNDLREQISEAIRDEIRASLPPQTPNVHNLSEHQKMVERFKNKKLGKKINQKLLEIEKIDPEYLEEIDDVLVAKLKRLKTEPSKKQGPQERSSGS